MKKYIADMDIVLSDGRIIKKGDEVSELVATSVDFSGIPAFYEIIYSDNKQSVNVVDGLDLDELSYVELMALARELKIKGCHLIKSKEKLLERINNVRK